MFSSSHYLQASKQNSKPVKSSEDDILFDDLIVDKSRDNPTRRGPINQTRSSVNFFSELAEEAARDAGDFEDSDVSEADPNDILKNLKDLDEMDADLFGPKKKPSSAPAKTKTLGNGGPKIDLPKLEDETTLKENKLSSVATSSPARGYKKFTFNELDDPLADLLADLPDETKTEPKIRMPKTPPEKSILSPSLSPTVKIEEIAPAVNTPKKREELTFDDDGDDLINQLGFDHTKDDPKKEEAAPRPTRESGERVQRARTRLDEILERGTSPRHLDRPPTAERKDPPQPLEKQQQQERTSNTKANGKPTEPFLEDDLMFGSYQPTLGSAPEGRRSRRQSVRFSTEDVSVSAPEKNPKPSTPVSATNPTPAHPRSAADWLSLKASDDDDDFKYPEEDVKEPKSVPELPKPSPSPFGERDASVSGSYTTPAVKMAAETAAEPNSSKPSQPEVPMGQKTDDQEVEDDWLTRARMSRKKVVMASSSEARQPKQEDSPSLGEELLQSSSSLGGAVDRGYLQRRKEKELQSGDVQARVIQLEGQVKTLQLERDQSQMLLESIQQRHKQDTELMENAHKARVKLFEEKAAQREARAHQECEDLTERLAMVSQVAEQECSELQVQHQRRLAQAQQDRDREVERLRDLQRKSVLEMKKDYEDQVQRLKRLKDEEIDAVTSATSQTRSLAVVIEQMEQFSQRLGHISSRVESTHEHTAQGLEQGARQRDEQLRVMQDRLDQQQRAMVEERARLKELIARMDTQLAEQQRQLEKERWRVTAEQAKAESALRGLEEEKRSMTSHINMEREELERAKSALLEEQQSVMQHCAEERRKLATEWSHFHAQEKQRLERVEREASRAMERDAHREGNIISLAQEQADLRLRTIELKQKEEAALRERETLDRQREEMEREKERLSGTALRLKTRAQEVEAFSKLAAEKYEEGEQALQEARRVETEHQARLKSIHAQIERLRQQEQQLHQERLRMTELRRERLGQTVPLTPLPQPIPPLFTDFSLVLPNPLLTSTVNDPPANSSPGDPEFQARLALLRHTAEKDRDYLQDEQFFLDTLKNTSYSSAFHTA